MLRTLNRMVSVLGVASLVLLAACGGAPRTASVQPSLASAAPSGSATPDASGETPVPSRAEEIGTVVEPGAVAEVLVTDLVVRSAPGTGPDSTILDASFSTPQLVYTLDGPVTADGYDWHLVSAFEWLAEDMPAEETPSGWVAAAGKDGDPWIGWPPLKCPPLNLEEVARLSGPARLACFGTEPITLRGIYTDCRVSSPETTTPSWLAHAICMLSTGGAAPLELGMRMTGDARLPGEPNTTVQVVGHFDDPAARSCTYEPVADERPRPEVVVLWCRTQFVPTEITAG